MEKEEFPGIVVTTNDASVMRVVQTVDGVEQDITPSPDKEDKKKKGGSTNADAA